MYIANVKVTPGCAVAGRVRTFGRYEISGRQATGLIL